MVAQLRKRSKDSIARPKAKKNITSKIQECKEYDKNKNQLAGVAALIGVLAAIGGGFVKYGEIITKLEALEGAGGIDYSAQMLFLNKRLKVSKNN